VNPVCAGNIALSEVDTWMSFQLENVRIFFRRFCPQLTIEKIREDQRREFSVVSMHLGFSG
jgi:hypothetical protein